MLRIFGSLTLLISVVAGMGWRRRENCEGELSDGPTDADVEVRIGNLPPSSASELVYLTWWAAKKSSAAYDPLTNPSAAEAYTSSRGAYADPEESGFNGGRVLISEAGEAAIRVQAPATYMGHRHSDSQRSPHVHFTVCGQHGRPKKVMFTDNGVSIKGGCRYRQSHDTVSYTVVSSHNLHSNASLLLSNDPTPEAITSEGSIVSTSTKPNVKLEEGEQKDWDALEFSSVYDCLDQTQLFDQFSSTCAATCPASADVKHGQCVRKSDPLQDKSIIRASWRISLDCNAKCWEDAVPLARHSVRLALADLLDVTFQEARKVEIRKDDDAPVTHANLKVEIQTRRLVEDLGHSLLSIFLPNASFASDVLGLTVHDVQHHARGSTSEGRDYDNSTQRNASLGGGMSEIAGEDNDQYAEYYMPLEQEAERQAQDKSAGGDHSIAGIPVPESVPVLAIVGAAIGVVVVFGGLGACFYHKRRQAAKQPVIESQTVKQVEDPVVAIEDGDVKAAV